MNKRFAGRFSLALAAPFVALGVTAAFAQAAPDNKASDKKADSRTAAKPMPAAFPASDVQFYETQVKPILKTSCYSCHEGAGSSGQLELSTRAAILKGGTSGPGVILEKPADSLILKAIRGQGRQMPPRGSLSDTQIETLTKWVKMGLPMPADSAPATKNDKADKSDKSGKVGADAAKHGPPPVNAETMRFWSFQPVRRPALPTVKQAAWPANPIDRFVLSKLESKGLAPVPPAARVALLRRATYDLTGLPPTPDEVSAFLADKSVDAYARVVDRLLASPQYGERWGRHWLDLVRYAETNSFERDDPKPFAWRYRDYVIQSLNADKPYDQFVREQLAGDEMPGADLAIVDRHGLLSAGRVGR